MIRAAASALWLLVAVPVAAFGQEIPPASSASVATPSATAASASAAGSASPAPAAAEDWIRPENIAERADSLARRLVTQVIDPSTVAAIEKIEAELSALDPEIRASLDQAHHVVEGRNSLIAIQDARRSLQQTSASFPAWRKQIDAEARRVSDELAELDQAARRWSATRERPETAQAGEAVVRRVASSLDLLKRNSEKLKSWRIRILALADRLVDDSAAISDANAQVEAASVAEGTSLFVPDHPPLWQRGLGASLSDEFRQMPGQLAEFRRSTQEYLALDVRPFGLLTLLAAVLMFLFRRLPEHAVQRGRLSEVSPGTIRLLERPYAMALLLALAAAPVILSTAPQRVMQVITLIALFPVARILNVVSQSSNLPLYGGLCAVLVLDRVIAAVTALPALSLATFLLELAMALVLGAGYRRHVAASGGRPAVTRLLDAGMFAVAFAAVAEIGGWSSLAELLGRGTLVTTIIGIYIYAVTLSLEALAACALASPALRRSRFVDRNQDLVQHWTAFAIRFLGVALWLHLALSALGLRVLVSNAITRVLSSGVSVGALSLTIGGILAFAATLLIAMLLSRIVHELLEDEVFPRANLPRGIPNALSTMAGYAIYSLGFVIALAAAGVQLSQLTILLGGFGVGIGLGLQDVVKNFAAGLTLLLERRVHVGDTVQIHDKQVFGRVLSIGMRASVVRNWNGTEAVLPNDNLVSNTITNWTLSDGLQRLEIPLQVTTDSAPGSVIDLLLGVARADNRILRSPPPSALLVRFEARALHLVLHVWTDEPYETTGLLTSEIALAIHRALRDGGIALPAAGA
ncbi:MAG TPA: mechanosensitive ion channel domain-containing protein [Candidatus Limnocylindrales bacterium]|nr:mechanosensitive ion channel domain-containing protein [Candidatus Limnocylindrales bacterium]